MAASRRARSRRRCRWVGFLDIPAAAESANRVAMFRQGLREAGFVEGRNVAIEFRWAEGQLDRLPELAADLVRRRAAVIVTVNAATPAAKAATSTRRSSL